MGTTIRSAIAMTAGTLAALALCVAPAAASYQETEHEGPPVVIQVDCISILARVGDLNEMVEALNDSANDAWDSWRSGETSNDDMMSTIRDHESMADQVEEAYDQAETAWGANGCKGSLPPLGSWDFPWRDLGIGG